MSAKVYSLGVAFGLFAQFAWAEPSRGAAACAAYDVHLLTVLEDHAATDELEPATAAETVRVMLEARLACRAGEHERGLALYALADPGQPAMLPLHLAARR